MTQLSTADLVFSTSFDGSRRYYVVYQQKYEGEIKLGFGKVNGKESSYLSHIVWQEEPDISEEIESYIDSNLDRVI